MTVSNPLDGKRPWLTDPDDLPENTPLWKTMLNPFGRSSNVPFSRAWAFCFFARLLVIVVPLFSMLALSLTGASGAIQYVQIAMLALIAFVFPVSSILMFIAHTRRLSDIGQTKLIDFVLWPNLILAPATLLSLFVKWPMFAGYSTSFGFIMVGVHVLITIIGFAAYNMMSEHSGRAVILSGLVLAPLIVAAGMFVHTATKGVTFANGVTAAQQFGSAMSRVGGASEGPRPRARSQRRAGQRGGRGRRGGGGGGGGTGQDGPPEDMPPIAYVGMVAATPTLTVWAVTSFSLGFWSILWVARKPRRPKEEVALA